MFSIYIYIQHSVCVYEVVTSMGEWNILEVQQRLGWCIYLSIYMYYFVIFCVILCLHVVVGGGR